MKCPYCGDGPFTAHSTLEAHVRTFHEEEEREAVEELVNTRS